MPESNIAATPASGQAALAYWECKAEMYPRPEDPGPAKRALQLRAHAAELGTRFAVNVVLDAGAGTGVHTLALAQLARQVVAIDLSPSMLAPLSTRLGESPSAPANITVHDADFVMLDLSSRGWIKAFDLVWCCMTPISGDAQGLIQLDRASRDQVCCVTWGPNREDPLFAEAFALHGAQFRAPAWRETIIAHAAKHGHRLRHRTIVNQTVQHIAPEALATDLAHHMRWLGVTPDLALLQDWSQSKARDGMVERVLDADQEIWLWSVGD